MNGIWSDGTKDLSIAVVVDNNIMWMPDHFHLFFRVQRSGKNITVDLLMLLKHRQCVMLESDKALCCWKRMQWCSLQQWTTSKRWPVQTFKCPGSGFGRSLYWRFVLLLKRETKGLCHFFSHKIQSLWSTWTIWLVTDTQWINHADLFVSLREKPPFCLCFLSHSLHFLLCLKVAVVTVVAEAAQAQAGISTALRFVQSTGSLWRTYQAAAAGRTWRWACCHLIYHVQ